MLTIHIKGLQNLIKKFEQLPRGLHIELSKAIKMSVFQIERETKPITPVDTGRLRSSIGGGSFRGGSYPSGYGIKFGNLYGIIGSNVKYAEDVHESYARHMVGQTKFLETGAKRSSPEIERFFKSALDRALR